MLFALVLFCLMIPPQAPAIPVFLLYQVGILNSYAALIVPFIISAFGIFLMRQFFKTVPDDLIEAARMDGISEFGIVWRVMLPTAMPAAGLRHLLGGRALERLFLAADRAYRPATLPRPRSVAGFRNEEAGTNYGPLMAATIVIIAPLVVAFLFAQRRFIEGITMTGIKG